MMLESVRPQALAPSGLSFRALGAATLVAATVGVLFSNIFLRVGFGPNTSLFSTLIGVVVLSLTGGPLAARRRELHAVQVAGVAAGQTAFMGVSLAAFDVLRAHGLPSFGPAPTPVAIFAWLASAGALGVLVALPLRAHYLERAKLAFASGELGAEAVLTLTPQGGDAKLSRGRLASLACAFAAAGALAIGRVARLGASPLAFGTGMLIGPRMGVSIGLGTALATLVLPRVAGVTSLGWTMAPAAAFMVSGGVVAVLARRASHAPSSFAAAPAPATAGLVRPPRAPVARAPVALAAGFALAVLCVVDRVALGLPVWLTLAGVAASVPLLLVGTHVLGETSWAPVSALATVAQVVLGPLVPGCVFATLAISSVASAIPNGGQHMMQSLRSSSILGVRTRETALVQLLGVVVGALALSVSYPRLAAAAPASFAPPLGVAWASSAQLFAGGLGALPPACIAATALASVVGIALALLGRRYGAVVPSPAAIGVGMLLVPVTVAPLVVGSLAGFAWTKLAPRGAAAHRLPVASGLVAGDALAASVAAIF